MSNAPKSRLRACKWLVLVCACALMLGWTLRAPQWPRARAQSQSNYKNFEAPQVHPLALTPDGTRLLALDTPEQRLEVFQLSGAGLALAAEIPVGAEPTSVAVRNNNEAWVANWLSDSVSVVDLNAGNVTRTFDVGDEPTDIVFAGQQKELAFVCVSGLRQVQVFDPNAPDAAPQVITIRGKQPRALTRDATGAQVFVSVFESGNQTTIVDANTVTTAGGLPAPVPAMSQTLPAAPAVGLIVKWTGTRWADETGDTRWQNFVPYTLADVDVVALDAHTATVAPSAEIRHVGTHIGNAVFDASDNRLYVCNLEARNQIRFEPNVRGRFLQHRVSIINFQSGTPQTTALDLNPHINYSNAAGTDAERAQTLSLPADIVRATDGTLYVAATGANKVGVLNAAGSVRARINVGQGPTGLALDETRARLYVLNRFDETVSIVDTAARTELARVPLGFNPEPAQVRQGRQFLYNGALSAHGDLACASCHLNGHRDGLAWDLGDPQGQLQQVVSINPPPLPPITATFHPMKGPMTTQSLRGIINANPQLSTEPLHWRGDRAGLENFNPAFMSLLGGSRQLNADELTALTAFVRTLTYPPNPNENLDRTLPDPPSGASAARGAQLFQTGRFDAAALTCNQCHAAFPNFGTGTNRTIIPSVLLGESQDFKVPQLRGLYQKTGFARAAGEQLSGYGFAHDGNFDTIFSFLHAPVFTFQNDGQRRDIEAFLMAFDTGTAPAVGSQVTVNAGNKNTQAVTARVNLLVNQANLGNCDLVVHGLFQGQQRGFTYIGNSTFQADRSSDAAISTQALLQAANAGAELTFTGVPVGAGRRLGIDRDEDGVLDGDAGPSALNLSGTVTAVNGHPIGGVTITVSANGQAGSFTTQTDANGHYAFQNLTGGGYNITPALAGFTFAPASQTIGSVRGDAVVNFIAPSTVQFSAASYTFNEGAGRATITVTRTGDTTQTASVNYATVDNPAVVRCDDTQTLPGVAFARCDYATTIDTLTFAPGETAKTFNVPLIDDATPEGPETVTLKLSEPVGATLGAQSTALLTITDDANTRANPISTANFFVRQHYLDFLSREPDTSGFNAWTNLLNNCSDVNNNPQCDRLTVSQSFFLSQEFQLKGFFVYKFYKVSFNRLPAYDEIIPDMRSVSGQTSAEVFAKRATLVNDWVARPEFIALYPNTMSDTQFVQTLLARYGVTTINTPDPINPDTGQNVTLTQTDLVNRLAANTLTRAQTLRAIVESREVSAVEFNGAFVAMQYYGYLRRTPEPSGYQNWLNYLNAHPTDTRTMVNGFVNSIEYQLRFGAN